MYNLSSFQKVVGEWGDKTFPHATKDTISAHLLEEVQELGSDIFADDSAGIRVEAADCLILLCHLAHREGFDLFDEATRKHMINLDRNWSDVAEPEGHFKHIEWAAQRCKCEICDGIIVIRDDGDPGELIRCPVCQHGLTRSFWLDNFVMEEPTNEST